MFRNIMIGFSITYTLACILVLLKSGFWIIPQGVLFKQEENFFLPYLLLQLSLIYLAGSGITEKRVQILIMIAVLTLSVLMSIREMVDVITEQVRPFSRPLVLLAIGQGLFAMAFLIDFVNDKNPDLEENY
jgi:hypothetical protein